MTVYKEFSMEELKVSIVVPVYNVEKYLKQCVESILAQGYENKEIILVDDGSTDNSPYMCDRFAAENDNVKVIHKENGGLSDARNHGIKSATGDYILFVDSDDFIEPDSLDVIMDSVNQNPVDIVFLEAQKYFEDGSTVPFYDGITKDGVYGKTRTQVFDFLSRCCKYPASACTKLIRRKLFENPDILFEPGLLSEDLDWAMKLFLEADSFDYCGIMYYNYRQSREGSITNTVDMKNMYDVLYILEKWKEIAKTKSDSEKNFILSQMAYEVPIIIYLYDILDKKERKKIKNRIVALLSLLKVRRETKYRCVTIMCYISGIGFTSKILGYVRKVSK